MKTSPPKAFPGSAGVSPALVPFPGAPASRRHEEIRAAGTAALPGTPRWRSRGYLPHFDAASICQHLTFRLADSLPQSVLTQVTAECRKHTAAKAKLLQRVLLEEHLDKSYGGCLLREPRFAVLVQNALFHGDGQRYRLIAWAVMPNHVHVLIEQQAGWSLGRVLNSWKSFTAHEIVRLLARPAETAKQVWQREYWDRFIRDEIHLLKAIEYIHNNPVKAGLVRAANEWPWSSMHEAAVPGSAGVSPARSRDGRRDAGAPRNGSPQKS